MAEFCGACTEAEMDIPAGENDFVGWLTGLSIEWGWGLCEGCGYHAFNNQGQRRCGTSGVSWGSCEECQRLLDADATLRPPKPLSTWQKITSWCQRRLARRRHR